MSRNNRNENRSTVSRAIETLAKSTEAAFTAANQVNDAFSLGLWYKAFPDYMVENLNKLYAWDLENVDPAAAEKFIAPLGHKFQFISNTGDSWHQCYRDLRNLGWKRLNVHRDGGRLQYLLKIEDEDKPEGFRELHLLLDISISTCKQVQIGTEMKEVPVMKTVCEDLVEIEESDSAESVGEVIPLVVVDDIEELQSRRSGEIEDHYDNFEEQGAPRADKDSIPF